MEPSNMKLSELKEILLRELGEEVEVRVLAEKFHVGKSTIYKLVNQGILEKEEKYIKTMSLLNTLK